MASSYNTSVAFDPDTAMGGNQHRFPTTRPSLVGAAVDGGAPARAALDEIIAVYWKPAYKHVRIQWRRSNEESKDLVQGFFTVLIAQDLLRKFDPAKGRLRSYLRGCLDHFVRKQDESAMRLKRGGGIELTFDFDTAERELASTAPSPEDVFLREWEREMFARALEDLRVLCGGTGKQLQYRLFEQYDLADSGRPAYADLAAEHGVPVTTVTNHLAWARRELRRLMLLRSERL
jgi:DNA-directed RNA polymerase specialized sigma24 family protein